MGSESEADKLAAPRLFGRKKQASTPEQRPAEAVSKPRRSSLSRPGGRVEQVEPVAPEAPDAPVRRRTLPDRSALPAMRVPRLSGQQAAAFTGLLVGAFLVFATYLTLHGCSAVRGTQTCGGAAGFPLLLVIGAAAVVGGGVLLRAFGATSPMGDSFLAVALVAVVSVLFLGNHYDAWWMMLVIPVLSIGAFCLAHWVSVRYIDAEYD